MSSERPTVAPPGGLAAAGSALWASILGDLDPNWVLDARELAALAQACRIADQLAGLDDAVVADGPTVRGSRGQRVIHPAIAEGRQLRLAQLRLLGSLELSDPTAAVQAATPAQMRARTAAQKRWQTRAARPR